MAGLRERLSFWQTALLGGLALGTIFGLVEGFSLFSLAFTRDLGITRGEASSMYSVYLLCSALSAPLAGRFVDRYGPGRVVPAGFVVVGMGLGMASRATALWHFYLLYALVLATATTVLIVAAQVMVSNSYPTAFRGRALGLAYACVGLGNFVLFNLLGQIISAYGWRTAYLVAGMIAVVVALAFLLLHRRLPTPVRTDAPDEAPARTVGIGVVLACPVFWFLFIAAVAASVLDFVVFQHLAPFLVTSGYSVASAGFVLSIASLGYIAGQLTAGAASDRWGRERVGVAAGLAYIVLLVGTAHLPAQWLVAVLSAGLGLVIGGVIGARSAGTGDMFAGPVLGRVSGLVQVGSALGAAAGTWLGGIAFDLTGGYGLMFGIASVAALVWCTTFVAAAPRRGHRLNVATATGA
ncbi:permease of the major facilitator superfamily [Pseudonocardia sp. Ae168_Ps1]|uniref:MFS transporter n=1 Tax=unclassified Pseudonocardia TaxID=2619320 RepID=UPI00094ADBED|nr:MULTISPECIES: MFS transporter [unclassified Pseudonocardia]OLL76456.1 permease of the major facilitator superfamily [Pseudonocardia sp. Ae150A_Ps1]OLL82467.1 permease of the major facilitator superfamily [Pseudonocardia sp. Ae168_Ps1]OLL83420.1 permease of the major facilitator superfamily [Pseudonocardia sp. Ae263_Ps1]OLL90541.1 permease of the major facilitator superfamily [Pseudonocardia sp. Ae356_Ps1]